MAAPRSSSPNLRAATNACNRPDPTPPEQPKSALISLLCELGGGLRVLNSEIDVLSDALDPVLRAEGPSPGFPPADITPDTSLAVRHCLDLQAYVAQLRAKIQDLSRRVE